MNYRNGLTRVYVVLTLAWICWGLYKPMPDRARAIAAGEKHLDAVINDSNASQQESRKTLDACNQRAGTDIQAMEWCSSDFGMRLDSDSRIFDIAFGHTFKTIEGLKRETLADTYWRTGWLKIAEFCLTPPLVIYLLVLTLGTSIIRWIAQGFSPTRQTAKL